MVRLAVAMLDALEADAPIAEESEAGEAGETAGAGDGGKKPLQFHPLSSQFAERPLSDLAGTRGWGGALSRRWLLYVLTTPLLFRFGVGGRDRVGLDAVYAH
jgi:hypothetical protein